MQQPLTISKAQIDKFVALVGENARPPQPLNTRNVQLASHAQTTIIPVAAQPIAPAPLAHAASTSSHGATTSSGHGGGHAEFEHVAAKPLVLVENGKLNELDRNRHREPQVEAVELSTAGAESSLWIVLVIAAVLFVLGALYLRSGAYTNRKLGFKLSFGFGMVIMLAMTIGFGITYYMNDINTKNDLALAGSDLDMMVGEMGKAQYAFILYGIEDKTKGEEYRAEIEALLAEFTTDIDLMLEADLDKPEIVGMGHISEAVAEYKKLFGHLVEKFHAIETIKEELDEAGETMSHELSAVVHEHEAELAEMEERGVTGGQLSLQTKLIETLFEAEILELKIAHAEVEFLLDKHIDRVATMEAEMSELYAVLATIKNIIPLLDTPSAEQRADIAKIEHVESVLHAFQQKVSEVIVDVLQVDSDLIDMNVAIEEIEGNTAAFAERMNHEAEATKAEAEIISAVLMVLALITGGLISFVLTRSITKPVGEAVLMLEELEKGHIGKRVKQTSNDEIGTMVKTMNSFADSLQNEVVANMQKLANGDLTFDITPRDAQDEVRGAIQKLGADLNEIVGQIQVAGEQIASGSGQVADASQTLSQGATEQAASLEEISASLNELSSQTGTNAENASQANGLATSAQTAAEKGSNQMQAMVSAMGEINEAGQSISKIIKVIDEIAFQTNLLALNAAVEAARAGQHGKGFAVVAEEVRNLAARSAKAAAETAELIEGSVAKTENGSNIANQTAEALQEIVSGIGQVTDLVGEIAAASNEQAQGVSQISQGVTQIDQVTQQNTANAEESAAAAEELSSQADQLQGMLQRFTLKQGQLGNTGPRAVQATATASRNNIPQPTAAATGPQIALDDNEFGRF